jgi:hypothetical protein
VKHGATAGLAAGALLTRRSVSTQGPGSNELYGLDGRFALFQNVTILPSQSLVTQM